MNKEFIPDEQAEELKELGFNERCFGFYNPVHENQLLRTEVLYDVDGGSFDNWNQTKYFISAPLYQQAFRWFREKYGLHASFVEYYDTEYIDETYYMFTITGGDHYEDFKTYEEAELACIIKLIEIAKNK